MDTTSEIRQMLKELDELRRLYKKLVECIISKDDATPEEEKTPRETPKTYSTEK